VPRCTSSKSVRDPEKVDSNKASVVLPCNIDGCKSIDDISSDSVYVGCKIVDSLETNEETNSFSGTALILDDLLDNSSVCIFGCTDDMVCVSFSVFVASESECGSTSTKFFIVVSSRRNGDQGPFFVTIF
jgi:hypothetical protein